MASLVSLVLKSSLNTGEPALMPYENSEPASCLNSDRLTWANRVVVVVGAASRTGQTVVAAFAAAGVHRIALVDSVDMSAVQDRALQAASANNLSPPTLLVLQLQHDGDASVAQGVEDILHKWGHVDFIIHHADHELFPVESAGEGERAIRDQRRKSLESGIKNVYSIIDAFLPLLLAGSEKTLINIIPADSADTKPGAGAGMIAELTNRQMADCLMVDHGCDGLLAYSIHLSSWGPGKGISHAYSANQGLFYLRQTNAREVDFAIL